MVESGSIMEQQPGGIPTRLAGDATPMATFPAKSAEGVTPMVTHSAGLNTITSFVCNSSLDVLRQRKGSTLPVSFVAPTAPVGTVPPTGFKVTLIVTADTLTTPPAAGPTGKSTGNWLTGAHIDQPVPDPGWICLFIQSPQAVSRARWGQGPCWRPRAGDGGQLTWGSKCITDQGGSPNPDQSWLSLAKPPYIVCPLFYRPSRQQVRECFTPAHSVSRSATRITHHHSPILMSQDRTPSQNRRWRSWLPQTPWPVSLTVIADRGVDTGAGTGTNDSTCFNIVSISMGTGGGGGAGACTLRNNFCTPVSSSAKPI